ncbi:MAG: sulfite exporter TauE/SafE family protein [Proteobacteria bacterium]|nr:sulfite exporter TauE/SafE family protein [Pseudomonadota bacterium]
MQIYLPIAEMAVPGEAILLLGGLVGFLAGVFGVGGGFLTTPLLIFMGIPPGIAVGTQASQLVASGLSGVLGHWKKGNVDVRMGGVLLGGSITGSLAGIFLFRYLEHAGQTDVIIPVLYVLMLGSVGLMMLYESFLTVMRHGEKQTSAPVPFWQKPFLQKLPYRMEFQRSGITVSAAVPAIIGFIGGLMVSVMGIGGGFFMIPAMIYLLGMPPLLVAGTSLFQITLTAVFTTMMHAVTNNTVDIVLAALLIVGSVVGVQVGVRAGRKLSSGYARLLLAALLILVSMQLASGLFIKPVELYMTELR